MNKQLLLIILLLLQSLSIFIPSTVATEYIIDGDKVFIDDEYVYLSAEPHTIIQDTDVVFELISKQFSGEIDVAFGINNTNMSVKNPRMWNGSAWNKLSHSIQVINQTYLGYNKWYLLKNVNVNEDVLYKLKLTVDVVFNTSGKYFFGVKRSIDPINQGYYIDPWWDGNWYNHIIAEIDNSYIDNDLINFTVLATINSTIAASCQSNGEDIRFINLDNTTEYDYEIDFWNASGKSYVWVKIPRIESGAVTKFLLYYNNAEASDNQNSSNTWDANYTAVWHLTNLTDSTSNSNTLTNFGATASTGIISNCYDFDSGDQDNLRNDNLLDTFPNYVTLECWFRPTSILASSQFLMSKTITVAEDYLYLLLNTNGDNKVRLDGEGGNNGEKEIASAAAYPVAGTWQYVSATYEVNAHLKLYLNTTLYEDAENLEEIQSGAGSPFRLGARSQDGTYPYNGRIDECRVSNIVRNASWLKAGFHSMNQTTGFITWGSEETRPGPTPPTGFIANTTSSSSIFLNWTKGTNATHTFVVRKTGGYPSIRTDGTNIYNNTGVNYSDSSLSAVTVYYYSAWSFNSTSGYWSPLTTATNHTGPANPTGVHGASGTGYLNITWTLGARADATRLVHAAAAYPSNPLVGTLLYNGTNTYYNDTVHHSGYYTLFSWNNSVDLFSSGYQVQYGSLTVRVYDENTSNAITNWDIFITNETGTQTYENTGNSNPLVIDLADLPNGANTAIKINATDYDFRLYYMNIYANNQYTLDAYLAPENISELYVLIVVDEYDEPVDNAYLQIQQYINATSGYENVSVRITDANGQVAVYLIPGSYNSLYKIIISKTGYETEIADYIPDSVYYGIYYPKIFEIQSSVEDVDLYTFWDLINFNATMYTNNTIRVMYEDTNTNTTNAQFYTYETFNFSSVLNATNTTTSDTFTFWVGGVNISREHEIILHLNHTVLGYVVQTIIIYPVFTPKYSNIETKIRAVFGDFELNFSHLLFVYLPAVILLVIFSKKRPEIGCVGSGLWMGFIGIYLAVPVEAAALAPFIITLGIILVIVKGGKSKL